jgi:hypothetical protein
VFCVSVANRWSAKARWSFVIPSREEVTWNDREMWYSSGSLHRGTGLCLVV